MSDHRMEKGFTWIKLLWQGLIPFFQPHRFDIISIILLVFVESGLEVGIQLGTRYIIDKAILEHRFRLLIILLVVLFLMSLMVGIVAITRELLYSKLAAQIPGEVRALIFERIQLLPLKQIRSSKHGELVTRVINDASSVEPALWAVGNTTTALFGISFSLIALFVIDYRLTLIGLILLPISIAITHYLSPQAVQATYQTRLNLGNLASYCQQNLINQPIIRVLNLKNYEEKQFKKHNKKIIQESRRFNNFSYLAERTPVISTQLMQLVILGIGSVFVFSNLLSIGQFFSFYLLFGVFCQHWKDFSMVIPKLIEASGGLFRIQEVLEEDIFHSNIITKPFKGIDSGISFENVSFSYNGDIPHLDNVSFHIPHGKWIALVGSSGSGKSTTLQLLLGLEKPDSGTLRVGGIDLWELSREDYLSEISVVFQDSFLFNTSIRDNIGVGKLGATEDEIIEAAKLAEIHAWISSLPQGYDTNISGDLCSGGQKQRLALARALVRNPKLLIMDEPTSALDFTTGSSVMETLRKVTVGRTVVMATHKLSEAATASLIIVFEKGQVVEKGVHQDLLARNGVYAKLSSQEK